MHPNWAHTFQTGNNRPLLSNISLRKPLALLNIGPTHAQDAAYETDHLFFGPGDMDRAVEGRQDLFVLSAGRNLPLIEGW